MNQPKSLNDVGLQILSAIYRAPNQTLATIPDFGPATGETLNQLETDGLVLLQTGHWSLTDVGRAALPSS